MLTSSSKEALSAWLNATSEESGVNLSDYLQAFVDHGLTKFLLHDIPASEWSEIVKPLGHRIILRTAAANVYLKAEKINLEEALTRLKLSRDELVTKGALDRSELTKKQNEVTSVDSELESLEVRKSSAQSGLQAKKDDKARVQRLVDDAKSLLTSLNADISKINDDKATAVKMKEEAIQRAVMGAMAPVAQAPPQQTPASPAGYIFQSTPAQSQTNGNGVAPAAPYQQPQQFYQQPQQQQQPQAVPFTPAPVQQQAPSSFSPAPQQQQQPVQSQDPPSSAPLSSFEWYRGAIAREECESLLSNGNVGDYMIRKSTRGQDSYSLSVRGPNGIKHFKVEKQGTQWVLAQKRPDGKTFVYIPELVAYYALYTAAGTVLTRASPNASFTPPQPAAPAPAMGGGGGGGVRTCCGMTLQAGERFCGNCGTSVAQPAAPAGKICSRCNAAIPPGGRFCEVCGTPHP